MIGLIVSLIVGGIAGWLAGVIMKGRGFGIPGNIIVGIVGGIIGGQMLGVLGLGDGGAAGFIGSVLGAIVLIYVVQLVAARRG
jgi:uncharacterized membrane protein YeaQ/YmgE (transglycosylase-associated protein family)